MDLKKFISESLVEIMDGLKDAQGKLDGKSHARICPAFDLNRKMTGDHVAGFTRNGRAISLVEYDVAVEAGSETGGGGSIKVLGGILGVKAAGELKDTEKTASRIKFTIPISYPEIEVAE
jgi:hypothetical protein